MLIQLEKKKLKKILFFIKKKKHRFFSSYSFRFWRFERNIRKYSNGEMQKVIN
jgi:ribosomal protein L32E